MAVKQCLCITGFYVECNHVEPSKCPLKGDEMQDSRNPAPINRKRSGLANKVHHWAKQGLKKVGGK